MNNNKAIAFIANFSILPLLKTRFGISDMAAGSLFSLLPVGLLAGSVSFGPVVERFGYRWVLAVASLFLSLGFFGVAHAGSLHVLRAGISLFGLGGGVINGGTGRCRFPSRDWFA